MIKCKCSLCPIHFKVKISGNVLVLIKGKQRTVVDEVNSSLASKCMDFCQALASQGQAFNLSIVIGPNFSFSLDTRSKAMLESGTKKRASPSTLRRNAKRREELAKKKTNSSVRNTTEDDTATSNSLTCDQCDAAFKTRNVSKIHKGKSHKETTKSKS